MGLQSTVSVAGYNRGIERTRAWANKCGRLNLWPIIASTAWRDPSRSLDVTFGGGASALRPKSDQRFTFGSGTFSAFVTLRARSRPPETYAAPIIASATSATACSVVSEWRRRGVMASEVPCLQDIGSLLLVSSFSIFSCASTLAFQLIIRYL